MTRRQPASVATLRAVCKDFANAKAKDRKQLLINEVACLIAQAPWGSSEQQALMDEATKHGLRPYYYADSIRVEAN